MIWAGVVIALIVVSVLGVNQLAIWEKNYTAKKRVEAAKAKIAYEEALFKRNLENLWQKPTDDETSEPKT